MPTIQVKELKQTIREMLDEYGMEAIDMVEEVLPEVSDTAVKMLKGNSRRSRRRGKHYADGWRAKRTKRDRLAHVYTVYNATKPGLTQLLEYGYVTRGGHRIEGDGVIADTEEYVISLLYNRLYAKFGRNR